MFCTRCGTQLNESVKFCNECGCSTSNSTAWAPRTERLTRPMSEAKIAGVCAGFARHFGLDVTLVRIVWAVLTLWPLPLLGVIGYIVAWIVMPKDPLPVVTAQPVNTTPAI